MSPGASACLSIHLTVRELLFRNSVSTFPTLLSPCSSAQIRVSETPPRPTVSPFPITLAPSTGEPWTAVLLAHHHRHLVLCGPRSLLNSCVCLGRWGRQTPLLPSLVSLMLGIEPRTLSLLSSHLTIELYPSTYESIFKK